MSDVVVRVEGLTRHFGARCVLDSLSFELRPGSVTALVGRNGAGKSTALRLILGLDRATRGRALVFGRDAAELRPEDRARIAYVAEGHPLPGRESVAEIRRFEAECCPSWNEALFAVVLEHFAIEPLRRVRELSRGQRAGLSLALALSSQPELLVLDDPCLGLDPIARQALLEAIVHVVERGGRSILFSSHLADEVERLADRLVVIDRGRLRASCSAEAFRRRVRRFELPLAEAEELAKHRGFLRLEPREDRAFVSLVLGEGEAAPTGSLGEETQTLDQALQAYLGERGRRLSFFQRVEGAA